MADVFQDATQNSMAENLPSYQRTHIAPPFGVYPITPQKMSSALRDLPRTPKIKAVFSSPNFVDFYQIVWRHIPDDSTIFTEYRFHTTSWISMGFLLRFVFHFHVMIADLHQTKPILVLNKKTVQELDL